MHEIPPDTLNSNIEYCIDEFVRNVTHREMMRDKWFHGMSLEQIAEKYQVSVTTVKHVIYDLGDPILLRASSQKPKGEHAIIFALSKLENLIRQLKQHPLTEYQTRASR